MSTPKPPENTPANPPAPGQHPDSVPIVKKTALKSPREIQLEKDIARLQDRQDGLEVAFKELQDWAGTVFGGSKPSPAPSHVPATRKKSALDETLEDLGVI